MSPSRPPRSAHERATVRLKDLALSDRERAFRTPRAGDWAVLALLVVGLAGCGLFTWYRLGPQHDHVGRAIFFGTLLLCAFWTAAIYTFKLSLSARVGPHGVSVVRGPWRTELPWREVARLTERVQAAAGQRYRWLVVLARDGRRLQIREDLVADYPRFRLEVFERYALWRDHGGTLGAAGAGPFATREMLSTQVSWWLVLALVVLLPGLYFALLLPETGLVGPVLIALACLCALLSLRSLVRRHAFTVDARAISAHRPGHTIVLPWREVARVDRTRNRHNPLVRLVIAVAGAGIALATRTDQRVQIFDWRPRVPEYLTLRGAGHHIRIALHRLPRPDDLLAWIEFYESVGRKTAEREARRSGAPISQPQPQRARITVDFSAPAVATTPDAPPDPWAASVTSGAAPLASADPDGASAPDAAQQRFAATPASEDAWLSEEPETVEMAQAAPHVAPGRADGTAGRAHPEATVTPRATAHAQRMDEPPPAGPRADATPAEPPSRAGSAPRGWGSAAWQQPQDNGQRPGQRDAAGEADPYQPPVDLSADLAASFAAWRSDPQWQPPPLPRFGPPPPPDSGPPEQIEDTDAFAQDDFLR